MACPDFPGSFRRFRPVIPVTGMIRLIGTPMLMCALIAIGCGEDKPSSSGQTPQVTVTTPNGSETLLIGAYYSIGYAATDPDTPAGSLTIDIDYSVDGGSTWLSIVTGTANDGLYPWPVPGTSTTLGRIRVTASDGTHDASDASDGNFTIIQAPTQTNTVSIGTASGAVGQQVAVALNLDNRAAVGSLQTDIQFDPASVSYVSGIVTGRGVGMQYSAIVQGGDKVHLLLDYADSSTLSAGTGALAQLTFSLIGGAGTTTPLTPSATVLLDAQGQSMNVANRAGSITIEAGGPTAEELTESGWQKFEQNDFSGAITDFDAAIAIDDDYGPAYVGKGWCQLSLAVGTTDLNAALTSFDDAHALDASDADMWAGRAAVHLGLGGSNLESAIGNAQSARATSPDYVFAHRQSFDTMDLYLIEAFAHAGQADLAAALEAADEVQASGIEQGNPATWVVDGTTYPSFAAAVLAFLHKLSAEVAG